MSANNWSVCPRCLARAEAEKKAAQEKARRAYGKVAPEEYDRLVCAANQEIKLEETLREDWELGVERTGEFYVSYHCGCQECGFEHTFKHEEKVKANG